MVDNKKTDPLLVEEEGHAATLLGNEAIVRGALEAGVGFASGYPGTPSSEITDCLARVAGARGIVFEYSVNEKIALEMAFAASLAGTRSICAMKHLGLMYAGDPLSTIPYVGARGGMVIVSAGDPSCRTSPNEQDQRYLASMLGIPALDPCTPGEAYRMTLAAFELSERCELPVLLRPTTRVCHSRAPVTYGPLVWPKVHGFKRDPKRLVPIPVNARPMRLDQERRLDIARALLDDTDFVRPSEAAATQGIIAAGAPSATCADLLLEFDLAGEVPLLSVGVVYPLPEEKLVDFLRGKERILLVEELSPYLEDLVLALCARRNIKVELLGKHSGHLPVPFEYEPVILRRALHEALGLGPAPTPRPAPPEVPVRPPVLCASCPHRTSYFVVRSVFGPEPLFFNDIGCYTLGYGQPLESADALLCMGAGITLAAGVSRVTGERTVGFLGDSTFFHSGMPALLNAIKEDVGMVVVVLDNQVTAMTGFQVSPSVEAAGGQPVRRLSIEAAVRGLGATHVEVTDPADLPATMGALERARDATGVSVVIMERPCPVYMGRIGDHGEAPLPYKVDHQRCQTCGRESGGHRCDLPPERGLMRHMARANAQRFKDRDSTPGCNPGKAPCSLSCPLFHCIQGYVGNIAAGNHAQALELILGKNPLPETVCRVCHRPCEDACVREGVDQPVAINDLKRFVIDWAGKQPAEDLPASPTPAPDNGLSVAVVGAGPSGLAAAHELKLRGYKVTLLDREDEPGGLLLTGIPEFRLPREALRRDIQRVLSLGITFRGGVELGEDVTLAGLRQEHDAVYLAMGASKGVPLKLEPLADGEGGGPSTVDALTYLRAVNLGLPMETGRRVAVVGGGNAAIDAARTARRQGALQITIVYRRRREEMPAIAHEILAAEEEGVVVRTQLAPAALNPHGLECVKTRPGEPDASGRCWPEPVEGSEALVPADQIILAIGQVPEDLAAHDAALDLEKDGCIKVDADTCRTSHAGVFAGGDVVWGDRTVTWAMGTGQRAAWAMDVELRGEQAASQRTPPPRPAREAARLEVAGFPSLPRIRPAELSPDDRISSNAEVAGVLSEVEARAEARRCLSCGMCGNCRSCIDLFGCPAFFVDGDGRVNIDPALCNGCGVCASICPNQAIVPTERS